jgi:hypothetical protein
MKKKSTSLADKTTALSMKEESAVYANVVRPEGYFADALNPEDIERENLIADAVARKNASHRVSE